MVQISFYQRSSDGNTLVVSSTDGYCSIINFKEGELGQIYQAQEVINENDLQSKCDIEQDKNLQNSQDIKLDNEENPSGINSVPHSDTPNRTIHDGASKIEVGVNNSIELTKTQDAATEEEPMEVIHIFRYLK